MYLKHPSWEPFIMNKILLILINSQLCFVKLRVMFYNQNEWQISKYWTKPLLLVEILQVSGYNIFIKRLILSLIFYFSVKYTYKWLINTELSPNSSVTQPEGSFSTILPCKAQSSLVLRNTCSEKEKKQWVSLFLSLSWSTKEIMRTVNKLDVKHEQAWKR